MADDKQRQREWTETASTRQDQATISRLATLLANGVKITLGEPYPVGWEDSRGGKTRLYVAAQEEHLTAARRLLGWDHPLKAAGNIPNE